MFFDLEKKEIALVAGGKGFTCHAIAAVRKGLELGGTVFCLSIKRVGKISLDDAFKDSPTTREAFTKGACGALVGIGVETISHTVEGYWSKLLVGGLQWVKRSSPVHIIPHKLAHKLPQMPL